MPRFFISASQLGRRDDGTETVLIVGDDAAHITKSLRMRPGETVTVCDDRRQEHECTVCSVGEAVTLIVNASRPCTAEPPYSACVYQALVKGDKFDSVVQKAVECGACRIVPFISSRCIVRLDKKEADKKIVRWQRIAAEAAKQCGRGIIPCVAPLLSFDEAVKESVTADLPIFCYENEKSTNLRSVFEKSGVKPETVAVMIGSEGGFSEAEAALAVDVGMTAAGLGERILRTETASSFALSCISYAFEM